MYPFAAQRQQKQNNYHNGNRQYHNYQQNGQKNQLQQDISQQKITLNDIIEYIEKNRKFIDPTAEILENNEKYQTELNVLKHDKNEMVSFTNKLKHIFGSHKIKRYGIINAVAVPVNINISFASSVLSLIDDDFTLLSEKEQSKYVEEFLDKLYKLSSSNFKQFGYEKFINKDSTKLTLKKFTQYVKTFDMTDNYVAKYIADFLDINIFVIDFENDLLQLISSNEFVKYKKNIFVVKIYDNEQNYEPLKFETNKQFINYQSFDSQIIKNLEKMNVNIEHIKFIDNDNNFVSGFTDLTSFIINDTQIDKIEQEKNKKTKKSSKTIKHVLNDDESENNNFVEEITSNKNNNYILSDIEQTTILQVKKRITKKKQ